MPQEFSIPPREIRPPGFGLTSGVSRQMIRVAQEKERGLPEMIAQWEMILTFFRHGLEVPLCISRGNDSTLKSNHRLVLSSAMAMGEAILSKLGSDEDDSPASLGYSLDFVESNLRYLRDTYQQWYVERDDETVESDYQTICDALAKADP